MSAVQWAVAIVFGTIGIAVVAFIIGAGLHIMLWGSVRLGPPIIVLVGGVRLAERIGGPIGGLLVILTLVVSVVLGVIWNVLVSEWIDNRRK